MCHWKILAVVSLYRPCNALSQFRHFTGSFKLQKDGLQISIRIYIGLQVKYLRQKDQSLHAIHAIGQFNCLPEIKTLPWPQQIPAAELPAAGHPVVVEFLKRTKAPPPWSKQKTGQHMDVTRSRRWIKPTICRHARVVQRLCEELYYLSATQGYTSWYAQSKILLDRQVSNDCFAESWRDWRDVGRSISAGLPRSRHTAVQTWLPCWSHPSATKWAAPQSSPIRGFQRWPDSPRTSPAGCCKVEKDQKPTSSCVLCHLEHVFSYM